MEIGEGKVWRRQIIVRGDKPAEIKRVLGHELTHVILADRFPTKQIPRWADEGIAVLSEPASRLPGLSEIMTDALAKGDLLKTSHLDQCQVLSSLRTVNCSLLWSIGMDGEVFGGSQGAGPVSPVR